MGDFNLSFILNVFSSHNEGRKPWEVTLGVWFGPHLLQKWWIEVFCFQNRWVGTAEGTIAGRNNAISTTADSLAVVKTKAVHTSFISHFLILIPKQGVCGHSYHIALRVNPMRVSAGAQSLAIQDSHSLMHFLGLKWRDLANLGLASSCGSFDW